MSELYRLHFTGISITTLRQADSQGVFINLAETDLISSFIKATNRKVAVSLVA
jgi:hypothetical protein